MSAPKDHSQSGRPAVHTASKTRRNTVTLGSTYLYPCAAYEGPGQSFELSQEETIHVPPQNYVSMDLAQIRSRLEAVDLMIVEEVARSRYLTSLQIAELISMRYAAYSREAISKHLGKLSSLRALRQKNIMRPGSKNGLRFYELDVFGFELVRDRVSFHSGNRYLSYRRQQEIGYEESALDVKKVLCGNAVIIGLLKNGAKISRFSIREVFSAHNPAEVKAGAIFRASACVALNEENILAYEVVRDLPECYPDVLDKIGRYYQLIDALNAECTPDPKDENPAEQPVSEEQKENDGQRNENSDSAKPDRFLSADRTAPSFPMSNPEAEKSADSQSESATAAQTDKSGNPVCRSDIRIGQPRQEPIIPQLVLCARDEAHARKIQDLIVEHDLVREEDPILFTEDGLNRDDSLVSLYAFLEDGSRQWYRIPGVMQRRRF